jgi:hypothetical protein
VNVIAAKHSLLVLSVLTLAGCGKPFESSLEGTVTIDGRLLTTGTVGFYPADSGPAAYGSIHTDGHYSISTGSQRGLPPGKYRVTVVATAPPADPRLDLPGRLLTPERYGVPSQSGLSFVVKTGHNRFDITLTGK